MSEKPSRLFYRCASLLSNNYPAMDIMFAIQEQPEVESLLNSPTSDASSNRSYEATRRASSTRSGSHSGTSLSSGSPTTSNSSRSGMHPTSPFPWSNILEAPDANTFDVNGKLDFGVRTGPPPNARLAPVVTFMPSDEPSHTNPGPVPKGTSPPPLSPEASKWQWVADMQLVHSGEITHQIRRRHGLKMYEVTALSKDGSRADSCGAKAHLGFFSTWISCEGPDGLEWTWKGALDTAVVLTASARKSQKVIYATLRLPLSGTVTLEITPQNTDPMLTLAMAFAFVRTRRDVFHQLSAAEPVPRGIASKLFRRRSKADGARPAAQSQTHPSIQRPSLQGARPAADAKNTSLSVLSHLADAPPKEHAADSQRSLPPLSIEEYLDDSTSLRRTRSCSSLHTTLSQDECWRADGTTIHSITSDDFPSNHSLPDLTSIAPSDRSTPSINLPAHLIRSQTEECSTSSSSQSGSQSNSSLSDQSSAPSQLQPAQASIWSSALPSLWSKDTVNVLEVPNAEVFDVNDKLEFGMRDESSNLAAVVTFVSSAVPSRANPWPSRQALPSDLEEIPSEALKWDWVLDMRLASSGAVTHQVRKPCGMAAGEIVELGADGSQGKCYSAKADIGLLSKQVIFEGPDGLDWTWKTAMWRGSTLKAGKGKRNRMLYANLSLSFTEEIKLDILPNCSDVLLAMAGAFIIIKIRRDLYDKIFTGGFPRAPTSPAEVVRQRPMQASSDTSAGQKSSQIEGALAGAKSSRQPPVALRIRPSHVSKRRESGSSSWSPTDQSPSVLSPKFVPFSPDNFARAAIPILAKSSRHADLGAESRGSLPCQ